MLMASITIILCFCGGSKVLNPRVDSQAINGGASEAFRIFSLQHHASTE